jgi:small subunit ribosomal protein S5
MSEEIKNENAEQVVTENVAAEVVTENVNIEAEAVVSEVAEISPVVAVAPSVPSAPRTSKYDGATSRGPAVRGMAPRGGSGNGRGGARPPRPVKEKPEFDSKAIDVRRVTRVVSGGRRFSLHVTMIAGDRNGRVGLGTGKAMDTQVAMEKALKSARKNMIKFNLDDKKTIKHEVSAKYDSSEIWISPNKGKGLIAGSSARVILNLAGLQNVTAKFNGGTKNKLNNARATMKALAEVAARA